MSDVRAALLVTLAVFAPGAVVVIVALLRGYSITLVVERGRRRGDVE